ncbi:leucyl aminopeptidase family protein, partial [Ameyamaea chiangmaiensis]
PFGALPQRLPEGDWRVAAPETVAFDDVVLGWCMGAYGFAAEGTQRARRAPARLSVPARKGELGVALAEAVYLGRDLVNAPPNALGPEELAKAARGALSALGAQVTLIKGTALARAYPMLAHVGAGSERGARVVVARWQGSRAGAGAPLLSLVGKGVCFDTGGYDIKPAAGMLKMKKDMGGAALMLALAHVIMARDLPIRLEVRLGCVENSISGAAMRPSDVVRTRSGRTVEIGNTDAEGRLVLCDLLTEACEARPDLLLDAATLTGAARVALGPDLPALFSNDDALAQAILSAGDSWSDPLWRLPLHQEYGDWMRSTIADVSNVSSRPFAGAVTAALFLEIFVTAGTRWAHVDTYAWNDNARFARPEGGETPSLRALFDAILKIFHLTNGSGS